MVEWVVEASQLFGGSCVSNISETCSHAMFFWPDLYVTYAMIYYAVIEARYLPV